MPGCKNKIFALLKNKNGDFLLQSFSFVNVFLKHLAEIIYRYVLIVNRTFEIIGGSWASPASAPLY